MKMSKVEKYIPSDESLKFIAFIRASGVEDNDSPEIHYKLADRYFGRHKKIVIESFRGSAKSSLFEWFILYIAVNGKLPGFGVLNFIAFVGDSAENGVKSFFRNIDTKIVRSEFLQKFIKVIRKTDSEMEIMNINGVELLLKGYGMKTNIRGVRYKGYRPDLIVLDDVTTNEAMTSRIIQQTIDDNFYKAIIPALHPTKYKLFLIGTPISENDILHQTVSNPTWQVHKFPLCEKFPCSKEEFRGNWEDRFPFEAVQELYDMYKAAGKLQAFYQEYMLELTDLSTLLVEEDDIKWIDPTIIYKAKERYNFYISTDFAVSQKESADASTIGVWAVNSDGAWMLVDGICKRQSMDKTMEDLFKLVQRYDPLGVGIENTGQQLGSLDLIVKEGYRRNIFINIAKKIGAKSTASRGIAPTGDKLSRFIRGVQPRFKGGKIFLPKGEDLQGTNRELYDLVEEMKSELSKLTMAAGVKALKHDDAIDLLNQMSEMHIVVPSAFGGENIYNEKTGEWEVGVDEEDYVSSTIF